MPATKQRPMEDGQSLTSNQVSHNVLLKSGGKIPDLHKIRAYRITKHSYRVNVWTGDVGFGENGATITRSYYVTVDNDGQIVDSDPPIRP